MRQARGGWSELALVWALYAVVAVAILVTYARLPAAELYHVTGTGFAASASRALVFLNFPVALAAIAVLLVLLDRLQSGAELGLSVAALVLCAAVFWPGAVRQSDLERSSPQRRRRRRRRTGVRVDAACRRARAGVEARSSAG